MKYNLGCGDIPIEGWENIDIKQGRNAYPLDIPDGSADVIRASHLIEHFDNVTVYDVLKNWISKLKIGGSLMIAVPDFEKIAKAYVEKTENYNVSGYLMGGQTDANDFHRSVFDKNSLTELLKSAGLDEITEWVSDIKDCASLPVSLNLCGKKKRADKVERKLTAIMSMPRLAFSDNMNCVMTEIVARGISLKKGTGVFWSQVLTRMIEEAIAGGCDYFLTIDYDTWFKYGHIQQLLTLMELNPDIDALFPMQMKRECDSPLMGLVDGKGERITQIDYKELERDTLPALTGHFGLTVFRATSFAKLKKPWFLGIPAEDGGWGDGRIDDDIHFWHNFQTSGLKAAMAPKVNIGHLQLVCTFPGHYTDNFKCIHRPLGDLGETKGIPEHCRCA